MVAENNQDESEDGIPGATHSVAPGIGSVVPDRFSSDEVFQRIVADADHEVTSSTRELFFSGLAAGFAITITFLVYASMSATADSIVVASLLYPLGFIYIIIGGYQLYTENTLPPVALTLERLASVPALLRHWLIVLAGNFAGGGLGAILLVYGGVFEPASAEVAMELAQKGVDTAPWDLFFKGLFAGLIVAGVVWINFAARDTISRVVVVYLAFLAIPLGGLFHVVVSFTEAIYLLFAGDVALGAVMVGFVFPVLLGNTVGGVLLVTLVNYYQTSDRRLEVERFENIRRLSIREMLLGPLAGRSYIPVIDAVEDIVRDEESYRILVPIANPRTETRLVNFACRLAEAKEAGSVHVVHIIQVPQHMSEKSSHHERIIGESDRLLEDIRRIGEQHEVAFSTSTVVSPRSFEEIFIRARRTRPDLVFMGWEEDQLWSSARAERPLHELTNRLPCDFLIAKDRGLDPSKILLPTAGGPDSDLSASIATMLQEVADADVTLLHVVNSPAEKAAGRAFLADWAAEHNLQGARLVVDDSGDVEQAICREAESNTLVLMGATERGLLLRLVYDSLHLDVVNQMEASMLLAERPSSRSMLERLFGAGAQKSDRLASYRDAATEDHAASPGDDTTDG